MYERESSPFDRRLHIEFPVRVAQPPSLCMPSVSLSMNEPLRTLLQSYVPIDAADAATKEKFLEFVCSEPRCFERSLLHGHVTGSAWLVDKEGVNVLLTHHRALNRWVQLGGHADGDPNVMRVAWREAMEESGLTDLENVSLEVFDIDIHEIPAKGEVPAHLHYDVRFAFRAAGSTQFVVSEESHDLAWVPIADISKYTTSRSMLRMAEKWNLGRAA